LSREPTQRQSSVTDFAAAFAAATSGAAEPSETGLLSTLRRFMGGKKE
jgi:hypothetical protein